MSSEEGEKVQGFAVKFKTIVVLVIIAIIVTVAFMAKGWFFAASVNGETISRRDLVKELERTGGKQTLDSLISQKLVLQEASAKNIIVTDEDINKEVDKITEQVKAQGKTLEDALKEQGATTADLKRQIDTQMKLERLLADAITVKDEEISAYIEQYKLEIPKGQDEKTFQEQIKNELRQQKLSLEAQKLIEKLKTEAKIKYYVNF